MEKVALYTIDGSFMQNGKWSEPDPGFYGEFIANRDGTIFGYCDELYDTEEGFKKRFIVGRFLDNGISFFKLSNSRVLSPLLYSSVDLDVDDDEGTLWAPVIPSTDFMSLLGAAIGCCPLDVDVVDRPSLAKLKVEKVEYSEEREAKIRERFDELDLKNHINRIFKNNPQQCKFLKLVKEEDEEVEEPEETDDGPELDFPNSSCKDEE